MARCELYNLLWMFPIPPGLDDGTAVAREQANRLMSRKGIPALILYPALATPAISVGDEALEILLLVDNRVRDLTPEDVNIQLKVTEQLDPWKSHSLEPLFETVTSDQIELGDAMDLGDGVIRTASSAFCGVLDSRIVKFYKKWKMTRLYPVKLDPSCLRSPSGSTRRLNMPVGEAIAPRELQDDLIGEILELDVLEIKGQGLPEDGRYAFRMGGQDVDISGPDLQNPIQSFHPVARYDSLEYASIGHASDIHVSSRQNVLTQSAARVADYAPRGREADDDEVPTLGSIVNVCSADVKSILDDMGRSVDVMVLGGDLVDYIRNVWTDLSGSPTAGDLWKTVALGDDYKDRYKNFVDYISIYTLIVNFYRQYGRPLFALSGNHDAYAEPYGISPRVLGQRANEGIPADHNLTLYEAILCFGETYDALKKATLPISPMKTDLFHWFYGVLTPWADCAVRLPKQHLVALAWGDEEDLLDVPGTNHGFGHLPRSDDGISTEQGEILDEAVDSGRKVILTTHFTFVSYAEGIPLRKKEEGDVEFGSWLDYGDYDMGTFETNREHVYEDLLGKDKIQVVLTGHSHRRALYLISRVDYSGTNSIKTWAYDFHDYPYMRDKHPAVAEPAIIVSDSAGSIPRENMEGEFEGWGSSPPSGTRIHFSASGRIREIEAVRAPVKPRIAVALDYFDLLGQDDDPWWKKALRWVGDKLGMDVYRRVLGDFRSNEITSESEIRPSKRRQVEFRIVLEQELASKWGFRIDSVTFYALPSGGSWEKIELKPVGGNRYWLPEEGFNTFRDTFVGDLDRGSFLSLKMGCGGQNARRFDLYDLESCWNFECKVARDVKGPVWTYEVERPKKESEFPDFRWRKRMEKYQ